jgi:hypothetical protein
MVRQVRFLNKEKQKLFKAEEISGKTMANIWIRVIVVALALIFEIVSGIWVKHAGRPYPVVVFAIHKLIPIGLIAFFAVNIIDLIRVSPSAPFTTFHWIVFIAGMILILALIASGGWISAIESHPELLSGLHKILAYCSFPIFSLALYLLTIATLARYRVS